MTLTKPSKRAGGRFAERNALAYDEVTPGDPRKATNSHVAKRRKTTKGLEVVFDPKAHKDYVTGFHKRKVARRKEALGKIAKAEKAQRIEDRADDNCLELLTSALQRRAAQRLKLNLERYETASESSDDERSAAPPAGGHRDPEVLAVYESGGVTTTVTAIAMNSDSDPDESVEGDVDSDGDPVEPGSGAAPLLKGSGVTGPATTLGVRQKRKKKIKIGHKQKSGKKKIKKDDKKRMR